MTGPHSPELLAEVFHVEHLSEYFGDAPFALLEAPTHLRYDEVFHVEHASRFPKPKSALALFREDRGGPVSVA